MMKKFSLDEIVKATGGVPAEAAFADTSLILSGISTDTRTISEGDAFFALIGENHDAHDHLDKAAAGGAALLVVSDASKIPESFAGAALVVDNTTRAYQELAAYYRNLIGPLVIAVTGSVGKTTLKDMIGCILNEHARVYSTQGNINNHIGVPKTILEAGEDTEILVLEMGLAQAGDIERLADIARPDISVITNIGMSHRENFDSDDGILKAKYEVTTFMDESGALVIDSGGSSELEKLACGGDFELVRVALEGTEAAKTSEYVYTKARVSDEVAGVTLFEIREKDDFIPFAIPVPGGYAAASAALASAVCARAGVSLADCAKALANLKRTAHRLDPILINGVLVIDDTYNASPASAKSGLEYLNDVKANKRVAVLADMNELGGEAEALHREVGAEAVRLGTDLIFTFGEKGRWIADGAALEAGSGLETKIVHFEAEEKDALIAWLKEELRGGSAVYVKGSRSMKMEEVVKALTEEANDSD